jgi:hypothetical protein
MKTHILPTVLFFLPLLSAHPGAVEDGRTALRDYRKPPHRTADLLRAEERFAAAHQESPGNAEAALLHAITTLACTVHDPRVDAWMTRTGVSPEGRCLLEWKAHPVHPLPDSGYTGSASWEAFYAGLGPRVDRALAALKAIPEGWEGTVILSTNEVASKKELELDLGDVRFIQAIGAALKAVDGASRGYNTSLVLDGLLQTDAEFNLSVSRPGLLAQSLQSNTALLTVTNSSLLIPARTEARNAAAIFRQCSEAVQGEVDDQGDDAVTKMFLQAMQPYFQSLEEPAWIPLEHGYREKVFAGRIFDAPHPDRALLPKFNDWNEAIPGTFPDPEMGGLLPGMTMQKLSEYLLWTACWSKSKKDLFAIAFGKERFVAVGAEGCILTSLHAREWSVGKSGVDVALKDVVFGSGRFVAVGQGGAVVVSDDGMTWRSTRIEGNPGLEGVAFGNGMFVAVAADGTIHQSGDGERWTRTHAAQGPLWDVCWSSSRFVAVGANRAVWMSPDGRTWTPSAQPGREQLQAVAGGPAGFATVGEKPSDNEKDRGAILAAPDGMTWSPRECPPTGGLCEVLALPKGYLACGEEGVMLRSVDGAAWRMEYTPTSSRLNGMVIGDGQIVAVGARGRILASQLEEGRSRGPLPLERILVAPGAADETGRRILNRFDRMYRIASTGPSLDLVKGLVRSGEDLLVVVRDFPAANRAKSAWIALYRSPADADRDYIAYTFVRNLNRDAYDVPAPGPGRYHFRLFRDEGYDRIATSGEIMVEK